MMFELLASATTCNLVPYFLRWYCNNTTTTQTKMGIAKEEVEVAEVKKLDL